MKKICFAHFFYISSKEVW